MIPILDTSIEEYLFHLIPSREPVLQKMEREAVLRNIPIVGPLVGRLLFQLATIHHAKRIYEMGSAIGYSTLWWAKALGTDGEVHYTDGSSKNATEAKGYIEALGFEKLIKIHIGNSLEVIDELSGDFDIIFCDIEKQDYPLAFKKALPRLKKGGLLIADNVLWSGKVVESQADEATEGIKIFNKLLYETPDLLTTIIPLRDGVSVSVKL